MHDDRTDTTCTLCGPGAASTVRFPEMIQRESFDFAARKTPERQHFRIVECSSCGLVYSNPILPQEDIYRLYEDSPFIQEQQLGNMCHDYRRQLERLLPLMPARQRLLEIGCSSGFFLKAASPFFEEVHGVEPGVEAVNSADPAIRPQIVNDLFDADLFPPASFDAVCCFQILDHLLDPVSTLQDACTLLKPGGDPSTVEPQHPLLVPAGSWPALSHVRRRAHLFVRSSNRGLSAAKNRFPKLWKRGMSPTVIRSTTPSRCSRCRGRSSRPGWPRFAAWESPTGGCDCRQEI